MEVNNNFDWVSAMKARLDALKQRMTTVVGTSQGVAPVQAQEKDEEVGLEIKDEIKDTTETLKVKEGEKGSLSYLKTLIGDIDESLGIQFYEYDDKGRITSMSNCDFSRGAIIESDITYNISYEDNGDVTVKCLGFVPYDRQMPASTTYHTNGSYDVTDQDGKITKFDKDGKEIKGTQETPKVKEGERGSKEYIEKLIGEKFDEKIVDVRKNEQGYVTSIYESGNPNLNGPGSYDFETQIEYGADNSIIIKKYKYGFDGTKLLSTRKFDANGNEVKDTQETPKVKEGERGSKEYIEKLLNIDIKCDTLGGYEPEYDEQGRIISLNLITVMGDMAIPLAGKNYKIAYNDDGSTTISSQMNVAGAEDLTVQKFDKDGKEIKDTQETPKPDETGSGSAGSGQGSSGPTTPKTSQTTSLFSLLQGVLKPISSKLTDTFSAFIKRFFFFR